MKRRLIGLLLITLLSVSFSAFAKDHPELRAFPPAEAGMERFVIELPDMSREDQDTFRVELIVGKMMITDGINLVRLGNTIELKPLPGWGYTYYTYTEGPGAISTMMAAPEGSPEVEAFVTAPPLQIRYNSLIPIVVYVPEGYKVQYRIWKASDKTYDATRK
jgi:ecotin